MGVMKRLNAERRAKEASEGRLLRFANRAALARLRHQAPPTLRHATSRTPAGGSGPSEKAAARAARRQA